MRLKKGMQLVVGARYFNIVEDEMANFSLLWLCIGSQALKMAYGSYSKNMVQSYAKKQAKKLEGHKSADKRNKIVQDEIPQKMKVDMASKIKYMTSKHPREVSTWFKAQNSPQNIEGGKKSSHHSLSFWGRGQ